MKIISIIFKHRKNWALLKSGTNYDSKSSISGFLQYINKIIVQIFLKTAARNRSMSTNRPKKTIEKERHASLQFCFLLMTK
jgi:hypothetical protein